MICRGDIYYAKLNPVQGSEQGGLRPVLVIQNDKGNKHCPTVIIAPITSKGKKYYLPTHVILPERLELPRRSMVMLEQIRVLDKQRLREYVDCMEANEMEEIDRAICASLALPDERQAKKKAEPEGKRLCLCPNCSNQFYSSPDHVIRRAEGKQAENSVCEYCEVQPGLDFLVINRRKRLGDC